MDYRNAKFNAVGTIDLEYNHPVRGWEPFTANPHDVEQLGRDLHALALAGEVAPYVEPVQSFEEHREAKLAALRAKRWQVETGGVSVAGATVRSDEVSQGKIGNAVALFREDPLMTMVDFEAQPGVWVTLDQATMTAVGIAVGRHVQACFSHARILSEAITAAEDQAALDAIDIDSGWPG